ncbi:hypothetical protein DL89DRAFT_162583 [Linderina pennispora]|uniref:Uncharacterized protein n=1 Tax=Linderina pennispora TaxID=61395 RepID=A0A1Y1W7M4_9FUNG|nr:uncharacterized protein DL89DRAFT_162583 [Linderina pennispora]ORX69540.1 hypothetical protein DL89DRAFT_162583 [Linderina pennispora]
MPLVLSVAVWVLGHPLMIVFWRAATGSWSAFMRGRVYRVDEKIEEENVALSFFHAHLCVLFNTSPGPTAGCADVTMLLAMYRSTSLLPKHLKRCSTVQSSKAAHAYICSNPCH